MITRTLHGFSIPALGLGTWKLRDDEARHIVEAALKGGWRHIDTAAIYENETEVGEGLRASGVARDQVWLTTKVWNDALDADAVLRAAEASVKRLGVDRVDLLLLHWPVDAPLKDRVRGLERAVREGLTRAVGVSNFTRAMFEEAFARCDEPILTNQVEYHPYLDQSALIAAAAARGAALTAYSPLAQGALVRDPVIGHIAQEKGASASQVALAWFLAQPEVMVIPKTATPERLSENLAAMDLSLDEAEMDAISALKRPDGRTINPSWAPHWDS